MTFKPSEVTSKCDAIFQIEACIVDIRIWMNYNDDKTELLIITTHKELSKISDISIKVDDQLIYPSDDSPRNLGVIFDSICAVLMHTLLNCVEASISIYIQLEG